MERRSAMTCWYNSEQKEVSVLDLEILRGYKN